MDSSDDFADLDLSTFNPRTNHQQHHHHPPSGVDRHDDGWFDDKADDDNDNDNTAQILHTSWGVNAGANDVHRPTRHSSASHSSPNTTTNTPDTPANQFDGSIIDEFHHPIMPGAGRGEGVVTPTSPRDTKDKNTRTSLNPFSDHDKATADDDSIYGNTATDDDAVYKSGHTGDALFIDSSSSSPFSSHTDTSPPMDKQSQLSPLNPFVNRAPTNPFIEATNPFASSWNNESTTSSSSNMADTHSSWFNSSSSNNTEYFYLSRLPEENLGMVFGIDGDQENRQPITSIHVKSITPGGAAARACQGNNRILVGDEIKEIDGRALNQLTHDECIELFQEMPCNVVLTVSRQSTDGVGLDDPQSTDDNVKNQPNPKRIKTLESEEMRQREKSYSSSSQRGEIGPNGEVDTTRDYSQAQTRGFAVPTCALSSSVDGHPERVPGLGIPHVPKGFYGLEVEIIKQDNQSLGLSIVPSYGSTCDLYQIKRLVPDGACSQSGCLEIGDRLLQCNGQNLKGLGQAQCLHVLKSAGSVVCLTLLRQGQQQQATSVNSPPPTASSFLPHDGVRSVSENTGVLVSDGGDTLQQHSFVEDIGTGDSTDNQFHHYQQQEEQQTKQEETYNNHDTASGTLVPPLTFPNDEHTHSNPFLVNSSDICNISGEYGDDSVFESPKQGSKIEEPTVDETSGYNLAIPPPAQFSDSLDPFSNTGFSNAPKDECVTNIDDLLSLDNVAQHNNTQSQQNPATGDLLSLDVDDIQTSDLQHNPFSIDNSPNPKSLEEFAELCFQNISDEYSPNSEALIDFSKYKLNHTESTPPEYSNELNEPPVSIDLISLEEKVDTDTSATEFRQTTQLPVSSEPDKFVSTIEVVGKETEHTSPILEPTYDSSQSPPFTTNINLKTSGKDNVSVIDVIPSSQPNKSPISSPTDHPSSPPVYSGSVVFHTYAGSSPQSISSASISLDGDPQLPQSKMNGIQESIDQVPANPATLHTTLGVTTNGQDDDVIKPMHAAKNEQGKVVCVQKTDSSNSIKVRNLNDSDVNELAGVLDGFTSTDSRVNAEHDNSSHVCEDDIVPVKMTRAEKESAVDVLNAWTWKVPDGKEKMNVFEEAVTCFTKSSEPPASNAQNLGDEETITPMSIAKNSHGQRVIQPSSRQTPDSLPPPQKNVSDLVDFLNEQGDTDHKGRERCDSNDSGVDGHVSEEDIVPTILSKKEAAIANNVVSLWGNTNSKGIPKPANAARPQSMGVARIAKSGDEEDVILPMRHSKDHSGNSMWLPLDENSTAATSQPTKKWDDGVVNDIASFLHSSLSHKSESDSEGEAIEEEVINAQSLSRGEKDLASGVLSKWVPKASGDQPGSSRPGAAKESPLETQPNITTDSTDPKRSDDEKVHNPNQGTSEQPSNPTPVSKSLSQSVDDKKVLNKVSVFENKQSAQDQVVLRPKTAIRNPSDFKSKLAGFEKSSTSGTPIEGSRARPRSMIDLPSTRKSWSAANPSLSSNLEEGSDKRLSFKPLSSLRALGSLSSTLQRDDKSKAASGNERPSSGLSGSLFMSKTPRTEYPKTRQDDGSPFQIDVLAGIVGLGLKVKASPSSKFPQVTDVQRNGPLGKSNNARVGDYLLSVNGTDLAGQTDSRVQQILRLLPRGLVKLVLTTQQPSSDNNPAASITSSSSSSSLSSSSSSSAAPLSSSVDTNGIAKIGSGDNVKEPTSVGSEDNTHKSTVTVKSLNGSETFLTSTGELEVVPASSTSKDSHVITEADFPDNVSSVSSSASSETPNLPPVTARIEINPGNTSNGTPMKISIKPTPTPRPSSGVPSLSSTMSRSLNYASSPTDSWDTSSADSTPRDSALTKVRRISGQDLIASQRKPGGGNFENKAISEKDEDVRSSADSALSASINNSKSDEQENPKPVEEEIVQPSSKSSVNSAPKALSPRVPPPVAPKPRLSTSSVSSVKSDDSRNSQELPKSPTPVAPRTRTTSVNSEEPREKEEAPVTAVKASKVSAGYERLQAIAKAKPTKPSRIIEKSRANVSSKAKLFEAEAEEKAESPKEKFVPKPLSSSLLPMSERRKSTGSVFAQQSSSLTRPKSLLPKGELSKQASIPEQVTSPTQESKDPSAAKSPTRMNSALSPRRTSLSEPASSMVFTYAPKQAPKISSPPPTANKPPTPGKVNSPQKEDVVFHKTSSPSLNKVLPTSLPPSKLESRSKDGPLSKHGLNRRSNSEASINMNSSLSLTSQVSEEKMEDTMKMFDDLLQDAPVTHSATDPADILLWSPVRKDRPLPQARADTAPKKESMQSPESSGDVKRPQAPPRKSLSSVSKKEEEANKVSTDMLKEPSQTRTSIEEDIVVPVAKAKDSHLPPSFLKDNIKDSEEEKELPVQEEVLIPKAKPKDSHLPPSFTKHQEESKTNHPEPCVEEDLIVPQSKKKDSHHPPAHLLNKDNKEPPSAAPRSTSGKQDVVDYEAQLRMSKERDTTQNIVANQLASDIMKGSEDKYSPDLLLKNSMNESENGTENIPAEGIVNSIQKDTSVDLVEKNQTGKEESTSENIPAVAIASDILENESGEDTSEIKVNGVGHTNGVILDIAGFDKRSSFSAENEHTSAEPGHNDDYVSQANEIVQSVITQISNKPELLFQEELLSNPFETASAASDDDEPPPLPGAPPPPVIFRSNSEMLTDTAWLDNNANKDDDSDTNKPTPVIEESFEAISASENHHHMPMVFNDQSASGDNEVNTTPDMPNLSNLTESALGNRSVDLNIVGQNIALDISKDLSGEEEEQSQSHSKSDISGTLNSTGESSFQEADAIRLHSPASVDVLSEDSGMPGDEEFQEVNTDDAISPVSEFSRDNELQENNSNVFTSKSPFYQNDSVKITPRHKEIESVQHVNDSLVDVSDKSPSDHSSPQSPTLPSSIPPTLPTSLPPPTPDSIEDPNTPDSVLQPSDSPPSSKEISTVGNNDFTKSNASDTSVIVEEEILSSKSNRSVESQPVNVITENVPQPEEPVKQPERSPVANDSSAGVNSAESENENVKVQSKRKWLLSSNTTNPSLVLQGASNEVVTVSYKSETLTSAVSPADLVSLVGKTNEVLDSLAVSDCLELIVIHIHREGETKDLGIDLKSGSFYKVTKIKKDSPLAKEGSVLVDDWLLAVDNLWFPEVSLMRCLARLTKPKHNSLLVLARGQESPLPSPAPVIEPRKERKSFANLSEKKEEMLSSTSTKLENEIPVVKESKPTPPPVSPRTDRTSTKATSSLSVVAPETPKAEPTNDLKASSVESSASEVGEGIFNVMMMKGATGVGFCLEGGVGSPKGNVPIIIKRIFKGGPAEKCGQLKLKDEILSVNGMDFTTLRHYEAWNHLKFLDDGEVHFKIRRVE